MAKGRRSGPSGSSVAWRYDLAVDENWKDQPQVVRALLRVEMADGGVREFEAEHPTDVECHVEKSASLPRDWPVDLAEPVCIDPGAFWGVRMAFRASRDPRHVMTVRNETARSPLTVLEDVRALAVELTSRESTRTVGDVLTAVLDHG